MDYEKKYKEALERMKSWAKGEHPECFTEAQKAAEFIFPELSENKDEKMIKAIKQMYSFLENKPEYIGSVSVKDIFEWLDKKGNIKFKLPSDFKEAVYKVANYINTYTNPDDFIEIVDSFAEQLLTLANTELEHKTTWSEEDTIRLNQAIYVLHQQGYTDVENWLKKLNPQKINVEQCKSN